jgi:hypothetical protein
VQSRFARSTGALCARIAGSDRLKHPAVAGEAPLSRGVRPRCGGTDMQPVEHVSRSPTGRLLESTPKAGSSRLIDRPTAVHGGLLPGHGALPPGCSGKRKSGALSLPRGVGPGRCSLVRQCLEAARELAVRNGRCRRSPRMRPLS